MNITHHHLDDRSSIDYHHYMTTQNTDIRQHIIDTAKPILLAKGFSAVGLSELLTAAHVPKGSFYHYFKSKESFGEALLTHYFEEYMQHLENTLSAPNLNAAECFMRYWQRWMDTQQCDNDIKHKCLVVKLGSEVSDLSESMRLVLRSGTRSIIARLTQCIEEGRADGSLPKTLDSHITAQILYNQWLGATVHTKIQRDTSALETAMTMTLQILNLPPNTL